MYGCSQTEKCHSEQLLLTISFAVWLFVAVYCRYSIRRVSLLKICYYDYYYGDCCVVVLLLCLVFVVFGVVVVVVVIVVECLMFDGGGLITAFCVDIYLLYMDLEIVIEIPKSFIRD